MTRKYIIEWYPIKDGKEFTRKTTIRLSKPCGRTSIDAHSALNIFVDQLGGLRENTIIRIQEFDENGQIGEDITPAEETNIIPDKRG